jgi:hypothetical protein
MFAAQFDGGSLEHLTRQRGGSISDDAVDARVSEVREDEWELTITPERSATTTTTVWFPWDPDRVMATPRSEDVALCYRRLFGCCRARRIAHRLGLERAGRPQGRAFAPLVVVADDTSARMPIYASSVPAAVRSVGAWPSDARRSG